MGDGSLISLDPVLRGLEVIRNESCGISYTHQRTGVSISIGKTGTENRVQWSSLVKWAQDYVAVRQYEAEQLAPHAAIYLGLGGALGRDKELRKSAMKTLLSPGGFGGLFSARKTPDTMNTIGTLVVIGANERIEQILSLLGSDPANEE